MKGITEIDERAALLLVSWIQFIYQITREFTHILKVRAYKAAYQSEGPRIRSEVWQSIAHQLNKQNTRNLTVTQWKKRISNIKSLVKVWMDRVLSLKEGVFNWALRVCYTVCAIT